VTDRFLAISDLITLSDAGVWGVDAESGGISILRSTNFRADGEISFDNLAIKKIAEKEKTRKALAPGDILVEKSGGGPRQPVGRVAFFRGSVQQHVFGNFIARLRANPERCEARFLFWFLMWAIKRALPRIFKNKPAE
jgi:type I restriction enzyme, S subunit